MACLKLAFHLRAFFTFELAAAIAILEIFLLNGPFGQKPFSFQKTNKL